MKIEDILSEKEIEEYHQEWGLFDQKFIPETEYHTHSGRPVIGKVFRFKEKPVFRARLISKRRLRQIDPYFISEKYIFPFWHIIHYFIVFEQVYHASMRLIRNTDRFQPFDTPQEIRLSEFVFWNTDISAELIWQPKRETEKYMIDDCFFAVYNDENNEVKGAVSVRVFLQQRSYITSMEKIKKGDEKETEALIKMVENRAFSQSRLINPRKKLLATKDFLIAELRNGNLPEAELHDFFSFWDK